MTCAKHLNGTDESQAAQAFILDYFSILEIPRDQVDPSGG